MIKLGTLNQFSSSPLCLCFNQPFAGSEFWNLKLDYLKPSSRVWSFTTYDNTTKYDIRLYKIETPRFLALHICICIVIATTRQPFPFSSHLSCTCHELWLNQAITITNTLVMYQCTLKLIRNGCLSTSTAKFRQCNERNCIQAHETACKLIKLYVSLWNFMKAQGTACACKLMELHASTLTCMCMQAHGHCRQANATAGKSMD